MLRKILPWWTVVFFTMVVAKALAEEISHRGSSDDNSSKGQELKHTDRKRLFATYATTTYTVITAKTSTVYLSCLSGTDATVCKGRTSKRLRRSMKQDPRLEGLPQNEDIALDSSGTEPGGLLLTTESSDKGKFGFTIWTTTKTTSSITILYTNTSSTLRLSYYCVAGGINLPDLNCMG